MKKSECKKVICSLCSVWREETGQSKTPADRLSSVAFFTWLERKYPQYLRFRSPITGVRDDVDLWFDQEFKQTFNR